MPQVRFATMMHRIRSVDPFQLALLAIVAAGLLLRLHGLNWDEGTYLHPDERFIAIVSSSRIDMPAAGDLDAVFDPAHSPLNPRRDDENGNPLSFAYGSLPVYVQSVTSWAVGLVSDTDYQGYSDIYKVGRVLNVVLDTLTIVFVWLIARRLFGRSAGIVAAALYAFAVLPIQLSHFFTVDIWLNLFVTASLYFGMRYVDQPSTWRAVAMAVPIGCAFATKASVPSLLVPIAFAAGWAIWRARDRRAIVIDLALAAIVALAVFTIFEPYALVRSGPFIEDIRTQARIVRGQFDVPFTRQFVGLTPGLYELRNLFAYALGPVFLVVALAGSIWGGWRAWRVRDPALVIVLAWVVAYVPTLLITEARFMRYSLPLVPSFAVLAGGLLVVGLPRMMPRVARGALVATLVVTVVWAIGFSSIYARENPRIAASKWMHANIPAGGSVSVEGWDDALPLPYPGAAPIAYAQVAFDVYGDAPPEDKAASIATTLQNVDYVVLSSDRVRESIDNLPWRYAVQSEYYRRLLAGQLGFQLVYEAELRPQLFGYRFDDSGADESFTVYDHPHVRIFKKVEQLSAEQIRERLLWGVAQPWEPQRYPAEKTLLLDEPVAEIDTSDDAGWNRIAVDHSFVAIVIWLLVVELIGLAVLPIAAVVLSRAPDRGTFSTRLIGMLLLGWVGWIAGSLDLWRVTAVSIAVSLAVIAGSCWGVWWWFNRHGAAPALPGRRRYLASLGGWLALFGVFLLLRAIYPDFWQTWFGGEKPFELAYLRAIGQATSFPPFDPWYADGVINYYYYGWHLLATVIRLSGVGVSLGFQLGSATFAGLFGLQVAALGGLLVGRGRPRMPVRPVVAGAAGALLLVLFVGNLDALRQVIEARALDDSSFDFWRSTRVIDGTINEFPYFSELWADVHPHVMNFPALALLLTILAHVCLLGRWPGLARLAPAAALVSLVLGSVAVTNAWDAPLAGALVVATFGYVGLLRGWQSGAIGVMLGVLASATAFALFLPFFRGFYSVVDGVRWTSGGSDLGQFLTVWGIYFGAVLAILLGLAVRREIGIEASQDGLTIAAVALVSGVLALGAGIIAGVSEPISQIAVAIVLVAVVTGVSAMSARLTTLSWSALAVVIAAVAGSAALAPFRPAAALALGIASAAAMQGLPAIRQPSRCVPWLMVLAATVTIAATEIIYVADDLQDSPWERMNTVFKFYLQAWILLAVGVAVLLVRTWFNGRGSMPGARSALQAPVLGFIAETTTRREVAPRARASTGRRAIIPLVVATPLLAAGFLYPLIGTPVRLDWDMESSPTGLSLDGYAWMQGGTILNGTGEPLDFTGDLAAIEWLNANVDGTPVILEASIGPYRGNGSRISSATGLPTVLGWDRHQRQQRYQPGIDQRMADVEAMYDEEDPQRKLEAMRRYRVRYVIVGDVERLWNWPEQPEHYASAAGLAAFDALVGSGLALVFESGHTRIYEVADFPRLPAADGAEHEL